MGDRPAFPGAIAASHLRVYDTEAPDGLAGGTPHIHTVCTESYYVIAGTGSVQTLTRRGFEEVPLEPGTFVWFTPGTIHRLVNGGDLEILVLMQNAGLPEAGDMVITFPPDVLTDPSAYAGAAVLGESERTTAGSGEQARARRDLGVQGFTALRRSTDAGDPEPLQAFYAAGARLVRPAVTDWTQRWETGAMAEAERTGAYLTALADGDASHLADAEVNRLPPLSAERRMGCCGTLGTFLP